MLSSSVEVRSSPFLRLSYPLSERELNICPSSSLFHSPRRSFLSAETNNPHASLGYPHIEVLFEPVTAATWMVDKIMNVQLGSKAGDGELELRRFSLFARPSDCFAFS